MNNARGHIVTADRCQFFLTNIDNARYYTNVTQISNISLFIELGHTIRAQTGEDKSFFQCKIYLFLLLVKSLLTI